MPNQDWLKKAVKAARADECISLGAEALPGNGTVVVLAPHPDDPDACTVFQRMLLLGGWEIKWLILTSGWSGVRNEFAGPDKETKAVCRRQEQLESARLFGIDSATFMGLPETDDGELVGGYDVVAERLNAETPDIAILPWGQDTNPTHRLAYEWFERWRKESTQSVTAFFSEDPKSLDFIPHLEIAFDEETAAWKSSLLECHRSQTDRNLAIRGYTFSERIISMNHRAAGENGLYAERYRVSWTDPPRRQTEF